MMILNDTVVALWFIPTRNNFSQNCSVSVYKLGYAEVKARIVD